MGYRELFVYDYVYGYERREVVGGRRDEFVNV